MIFICDECGLEMDLDEGEDEFVECTECDGYMSAYPEMEL